MKTWNAALALTLGLAALTTACKVGEEGQKAKPAQQLFTVGSTAIPVEEFSYIYNKNNSADSTAHTEKSLREYLNLFVNFKLKVEEAKRLGLDTTKDFLNEFADYKKQLARPYLTENSITEKMVNEAYERLKEEINASHLLIQVGRAAEPADTLAAYQKISQLRQRALNGDDFGQLALQYSEDPSAKINRGSLGYFTALQMIYPFENAAYNTAPGQISPVVRTQFGYHIIKVNSRRPSNGAVKVAHIMVRNTGEGISKQDSINAQSKIQEIERQLRNGVNWDTLCRKYSDDLGSRDLGGELQWFSAGNMIPPFEEAAFGLKKPGDISAPVLTEYGWHLIKLLERKPLEPLEEMRPVLVQRVSKDSRAEVNRELLLQKLRKEHQFAENANVKALLANKVDTSLTNGNWRYSRSDKDLAAKAFSIGEKTYTLAQVMAYVESNSAPQADKKPAEYAAELYGQYVNQCILEAEERQLPQKFPEYGYLVNEYRDGILLFKIMEDKVWTKAVADQSGLDKFFEANREKYRWGNRVKATMYSSESRATLDQLKEGLKKELYENTDVRFAEMRSPLNGQAADSVLKPLTDRLAGYARSDSNVVIELRGYYVKGEKATLAKARIEKVKALLAAKGVPANRIAEKDSGLLALPPTANANLGGGVRVGIFSKSKRVLVQQLNAANPLAVQVAEGWFQKGENKVADQVEWKPGTSDISLDGKFHYVIVEAAEAPRLKRLDETRGMVISDYQNFLEQEWLKELRTRYPVSVNEEALKTLIKR